MARRLCRDPARGDVLFKLLPEDFVVSERTRFQPAPAGPVAVYELRKRKLGTFDALRLLAARHDVPLDRFTTLGLKDRQAVTTQLVSVEGARLDPERRVSGIRLRYLGASAAPLDPTLLEGNAFEVVVRDLDRAELATVPERAAQLTAHGLIDYFDDQRFGALAAGQGLPARELVRGDFEGFVLALLASPSALDPPPMRRVKHLVQRVWGDFDQVARVWGNRPLRAVVQHLRRKPGDWAGALRRMPAKERALHVFAYQSWVWNESVARYLARRVPAERLARTPYVGGEHVWLDVPPHDPAPELVATFPLLDATVAPTDPDVRAAVDATLEAEGLTLERFAIEGLPGCFFRHEERPLVVRPGKLTVGDPEPDERRPGRLKVRVGFELPPGAYATLVLKRLFGVLPQDGTRVRKGAGGDRPETERGAPGDPRERAGGGGRKQRGRKQRGRKGGGRPRHPGR